MALGRVDAAIDALQKSSGGSADSIAFRSMVIGLRDPASRDATIDAMSRSTIAGMRPMAIPFVRWLRGDSATLDMIDAAGVPWRENGGSSILYFYLGPRLRENARVRALAEREGFPPMDSLMVR